MVFETTPFCFRYSIHLSFVNMIKMYDNDLMILILAGQATEITFEL